MTMTTTDAPHTRLVLPAGYEDWEEVSYPGIIQPHIHPIGPEYLKVECREYSMSQYGRDEVVRSTIRYFVPPKPKPTLPDVRPGSVIRYTSKAGRPVRVIYRSAHVWHTFQQPYAPVNFACHVDTVNDSDLLNDVDANGFLVELDGL